MLCSATTNEKVLKPRSSKNKKKVRSNEIPWMQSRQKYSFEVPFGWRQKQPQLFSFNDTRPRWLVAGSRQRRGLVLIPAPLGIKKTREKWINSTYVTFLCHIIPCRGKAIVNVMYFLFVSSSWPFIFFLFILNLTPIQPRCIVCPAIQLMMPHFFLFFSLEWWKIRWAGGFFFGE